MDGVPIAHALLRLDDFDPGFLHDEGHPSRYRATRRLLENPAGILYDIVVEVPLLPHVRGYSLLADPDQGPDLAPTTAGAGRRRHLLSGLAGTCPGC